jgi:succinate-semialdehyde dehydrogenase / glutarate-semialdehyde dehydrogenase
VRRGARVLLGGELPTGRGAYYPPTVLDRVRRGMPAHDEELFGPVAAIIEARDAEAALAAANATPYGLGAALYTRDRRRAERFARDRIDAGMIFVNTPARSHIAVPFGGTKQSGYGRELGALGVRTFTNPKTLWLA